MGLAVKNSDQKIPRIPARLYNETFYKFLRHFFFAIRQESEYLGYGNMGCQISEGGIQNKIAFSPKINILIVSFELTFW